VSWFAQSSPLPCVCSCPIVVAAAPQDDEKDFAYDEVFGEDSTQDGFYDRTAKHVLDQTVAGYNACVFACELPSSGETTCKVSKLTVS
jgi:hypothetical protein